MPVDAAPPPAIVITKTERHVVREEAIERVARQLCLAEGCDPDGNIQCGPVDLTTMTTNCTAMFLPYPTSLRWYAYRDRAEKMLKEAFQ